MAADSLGYYATLGLKATASAVEIKTAYRRLAKDYHPDTGAAGDGGVQFQKLSEAYAVLSDAEKRASYDSYSEMPREATSTRQTQRLEPLRCRACGQIAAQPRYLIFWRVVSFLVATYRTPVQGIYCSPCASREATRSTFLTSVFGWWGFPWGPIWTVAEGLKNAFGGTRDEMRDEILLWHNALAFASSGNAPLTYGLAERLLSAKDQEIQAGAAELVSLLRSRGFEPGGRLVDPRKTRNFISAYRLAVVAALPVLLVTILLFSNPTSTATSLTSYSPANSLYSPPPAGTLTTVSSGSSLTAQQAPSTIGETCRNVPANGKILTGLHRLKPKGHVITIQNGSGGDAIVKVRNADTNSVVASFFVASSRQADLKGLPDGDYRIQYAFGDRLAESCRKFAGTPNAGEFPDVERFRTTEEPDDLGNVMIRRVRMSYTLYAVPSGNVQPNTIDATAFDAP